MRQAAANVMERQRIPAQLAMEAQAKPGTDFKPIRDAWNKKPERTKPGTDFKAFRDAWNKKPERTIDDFNDLPF